jgi:hypothetical protein
VTRFKGAPKTLLQVNRPGEPFVLNFVHALHINQARAGDDRSVGYRTISFCLNGGPGRCAPAACSERELATLFPLEPRVGYATLLFRMSPIGRSFSAPTGELFMPTRTKPKKAKAKSKRPISCEKEAWYAAAAARFSAARPNLMK